MKRSQTANDTNASVKRPVLLDITVVFSIFLVIGAFSYMILNPSKTQSDVRNAQRNMDILKIMESMVVYVEKTGNIPEELPINRECASRGNEICKPGASDCKGYVDFSTVLEADTLKTLPTDISRIEGNGTGYYISNDGEGSILICAPLAERNVDIEIKQFMF